MSEPWNFTEAQRRQFREAHAEATRARLAHVRETTTPMDDGTLLADCSCGASYSVPQGGDEFGALEEAHRRHVADAAREAGQ